MSREEPGRLQVYLALLGERIESSSYKKLVDSLGLRGDEWVIDYGSGTGAASELIAQRLTSGHLTCVDISRALIEVVKKRLHGRPNVDFKLGDIVNLDLKDGRYDVVVIRYVLHDIPRPERQEKVNALSRKLKPGGKVFVVEPVADESEAARTHGMHLGAFTPGDIRQLMGSAGLIEVNMRVSNSMLWGRTCHAIFQKT